MDPQLWDLTEDLQVGAQNLPPFYAQLSGSQDVRLTCLKTDLANGWYEGAHDQRDGGGDGPSGLEIEEME